MMIFQSKRPRLTCLAPWLLPFVLLAGIACEKVSVEQKTITRIETAPGPEDMVYDPAHNRILVSCNERRSGMPDHSEIQQLDLDRHTCTNLPLTNLPPAYEFHPVGIDLRVVNGTMCLYAVNYSSIKSVVQFNVFADRLEYVRDYRNELLITPNDVTVLPDGGFYFSNDKDEPNVLQLLINPKGGSVVYCDGLSSWTKMDSMLGFPNGLLYEDGILYIATSRNHALYRYDVQPNGDLVNRSVLSTVNGLDNISVQGDNLVIAAHPDEVKFALLSFLPTTLSPSRTYSINKYTGAAEVLFNDDGSRISGSSTGIVVGKDLYLSQVFGDYILHISNYAN